MSISLNIADRSLNAVGGGGPPSHTLNPKLRKRHVPDIKGCWALG